MATRTRAHSRCGLRLSVAAAPALSQLPRARRWRHPALTDPRRLRDDCSARCLWLLRPVPPPPPATSLTHAYAGAPSQPLRSPPLAAAASAVAAAAQAAALAQLIVMPYTSLLSRETRRALGVRLRGNVVIVDEAHNIVEAVNAVHSAVVRLPALTRAHSQLSQYLVRRVVVRSHHVLYWLCQQGGGAIALAAVACLAGSGIVV
jgi:DEAD_2